MFVGIVMLLAFAIIEDSKNKVQVEKDEDEESIFEQRTKRVFKKVMEL